MFILFSSIILAFGMEDVKNSAKATHVVKHIYKM
jgi:hypothetical protein